MAVGDYCGVPDARAIARKMGELTGLGPTRILVSFYGFPPMPSPPGGLTDGTGRMPSDVDRAWAGHPVFWLDNRTRQKLPGELTQCYIIRMWLEILVRGYWTDHDSATGWVDVLDLEGLDQSDININHRLYSWARGETSDAQLDGLVLADGQLGQLSPNWPHEQSRLLYLQHELAWQQQQLEQEQRVGFTVVAAHEFILQVRPDQALEPLALALTAWERQSDDPLALREQLDMALQHVNQVFDMWTDFNLVLQLCSDLDDETHYQIRLLAEAHQVQRHADMDNMFARIQGGLEFEATGQLMTMCWDLAQEYVAQSEILRNTHAGQKWLDRRAPTRSAAISQLEAELAEARMRVGAV